MTEYCWEYVSIDKLREEPAAWIHGIGFWNMERYFRGTYL